MKSLVFVSALMICLAATAAAGERAISKSTLAEMGLGTMQPLSDHDGRAVRGQGLLDGLLSWLIPGWPPEVPDPAPVPGPGGPPTGPPPSYQSPFGNDSILGQAPGSTLQFGTLPSGDSFGFHGNFPWPLSPM